MSQMNDLRAFVQANWVAGPSYTIEHVIQSFDQAFPTHRPGGSTPRNTVHRLMQQLVSEGTLYRPANTENDYRVPLSTSDKPAGDPAAPSSLWTEDELHVAVDAYVDMLDRTAAGRPFVKSELNAELRATKLRGRSRSSIEFRFQNISHVLAALGRSWVPGYYPATQVGPRAAGIIEARLRTHGITAAQTDFNGDAGAPTADDETFIMRSTALLEHEVPLPAGTNEPAATTSTTTRYARDPKVGAYVRAQANGNCEACGAPAPFTTGDQPFLEVHHVLPLASGGSDTVTNTVAICANCHRALHLADDAHFRTAALYDRVERLIAE